MRLKILCIFGTRPEAIKMAPLVAALREDDDFECLVCVTAQHRDMLDQALGVFRIRPDFDLNIMRPRQSLETLTATLVKKLSRLLRRVRPGLVLVHGDTTTTFAAALAAFYNRIPAGHVEAGLRTHAALSPWPEEMNRRLAARLCSLHFAPTALNAQNLRREGVAEHVYVTGNTVIDALMNIAGKTMRFCSRVLNRMDFDSGRYVLLTVHRRENIGRPLENVCRAVKRLAKAHPDVTFVCPVHRNPAVRGIVYGFLRGVSGVVLIDPVDVADLYNLLRRCELVMTDSGGLQEEAPAFGVPVVVLRDTTERPEAIAAGLAVLAGTEEARIFALCADLLNGKATRPDMKKAANPYGDGRASERIRRAIRCWAGLPGESPEDFTT